MKKKLIYVDMDDTIADFKGTEVFKDGFDVSFMFEPGFFRNLKPIAGAQVAIRQLIRLGYDVQILSQPVAESSHSYSEKIEWIGMYFPELISKINLTQDKGLFRGDYLIDDNKEKWKDRFEFNGGKFIFFDYEKNHRDMWESIVTYLELQKELGEDYETKP